MPGRLAVEKPYILRDTRKACLQCGKDYLCGEGYAAALFDRGNRPRLGAVQDAPCFSA